MAGFLLRSSGGWSQHWWGQSHLGFRSFSKFCIGLSFCLLAGRQVGAILNSEKHPPVTCHIPFSTLLLFIYFKLFTYLFCGARSLNMIGYPSPLSTSFNSSLDAGHRWLMSVILATWETEIRRIKVQGQLRQTSCKTLAQK
jgi:hypothetical protein